MEQHIGPVLKAESTPGGAIRSCRPSCGTATVGRSDGCGTLVRIGLPSVSLSNP
ncbi:hypothetical protein ACFFQW_38275 [Umezawaea endophytica]|uniref:Uncharacterized protein n=1 Tax=Umezawaea endophytica TaxID=1654476 RepID=A0A9X3A6W5_9PSEU|nr:hypothetical protein [Umezawaea endophytica]MCS7483793.1 hypothetical protein [Umezawaea endophytica]